MLPERIKVLFCSQLRVNHYLLVDFTLLWNALCYENYACQLLKLSENYNIKAFILYLNAITFTQWYKETMATEGKFPLEIASLYKAKLFAWLKKKGWPMIVQVVL